MLCIDSSNFNDVSAAPDQYEQASIDLFVDNLKPDRTDLDILFQVLPKFRIPLSAKIEELDINGKAVFNVNDGQLVACFSSQIDNETIERIAQMRPLYAVFRDACLADDATAAKPGGAVQDVQPRHREARDLDAAQVQEPALPGGRLARRGGRVRGPANQAPAVYLRDLGKASSSKGMDSMFENADLESSDGYSNAAVRLSAAELLSNVQAVQHANNITPSASLAPWPRAPVNLDVEMETGTGKTYTYVKTIYELNARYGWSRFIIVVPSVAVREGVYRSLQTTQEHFAGEYGRRLRFFIYNSDRLAQVDRFASDSAIQVMIINMQAFNSGRNQRIIDQRPDSFRAAAPSTSSRPPGLFSSLTSPRAWRAARLGRACASSTPCSPCATPPPTGRRTTWCTVWTPWTPITGIW